MKKILMIALSLLLSTSLVACSQNETEVVEEESETIIIKSNDYVSKDSIEVNETIENAEDGEHAIEVSNEEESYSNIKVIKTGDSSGDEADFYGENAAIFVSDDGTLNLDEIIVETNGTHANGVFSYGTGTVNISNSYIETSGNCSGGLMTTGGGTTNANNLYIHTSGNSSAAIRSDRGGGTVNVDEGYYITDGKGSPVIYSTADITVSNAYLESTSAQGVVVEGENGVVLENVELVANNVSKNSDKSDYYQAVMIYQSMSGDADEGLAYFTMIDGSLTNKSGDIFFVNNTVATISLTNVKINNLDENGVFLRAEAAGWGNEGSNGGHVTLKLSNQNVEGDIVVDDISSLNMYLTDSSTYNGAINQENEDGEIYVEIEEGSKWVLTGDSYITSLTCQSGSIDTNGYKLYINGEEYVEGNTYNGEAVVVATTNSNSQSHNNSMPQGTPPEKPNSSNNKEEKR
ncbi:MAG: hypothetical protein IJH31_05550 [Erysipelotrichaceae bacterium]|nr:hypothetical protein [Erysipelotrichaceae bacterium]